MRKQIYAFNEMLIVKNGQLWIVATAAILYVLAIC